MLAVTQMHRSIGVFSNGVRSYSPSERTTPATPLPAGRIYPAFELRADTTAAREKTKVRAGEDVMTKHGRAADDVLDEHHLRRMTLGDQSLEREVLQVFARQITLMLKRIAPAEPTLAAAAAHTLKGSARGLGAWRVAHAAEQLEQAAAGLGDLSEAIAELEIASNEVRGAIEARLHEVATETFAPYGHASAHLA
jgi:HPt (histidine-containing phosphotransfer) domain-containing protein